MISRVVMAAEISWITMKMGSAIRQVCMMMPIRTLNMSRPKRGFRVNPGVSAATLSWMGPQKPQGRTVL